MLVVEGYGALDGIVADGITMSEIFGDDASAGFVLLRDVILVAGCIVCACGFACNVFEIGGAGDLDLGAAKLGVVEQESSFCGAIIPSAEKQIGEILGRLTSLFRMLQSHSAGYLQRQMRESRRAM